MTFINLRKRAWHADVAQAHVRHTRMRSGNLSCIRILHFRRERSGVVVAEAPTARRQVRESVLPHVRPRHRHALEGILMARFDPTRVTPPTLVEVACEKNNVSNCMHGILRATNTSHSCTEISSMGDIRVITVGNNRISSGRNSV